MSPQRRIMGHKKEAKAKGEDPDRLPERLRPLYRRLTMTGGPGLLSVEWEMVHAYQDAQKAKKKDTP